MKHWPRTKEGVKSGKLGVTLILTFLRKGGRNPKARGQKEFLLRAVFI
jgi:hypothetical protein